MNKVARFSFLTGLIFLVIYFFNIFDSTVYFGFGGVGFYTLFLVLFLFEKNISVKVLRQELILFFILIGLLISYMFIKSIFTTILVCTILLVFVHILLLIFKLYQKKGR